MEEIELFKELEEENESSITINGDVIISIQNGEKKLNLKTLRGKIKKPLKDMIRERDSKKCICCGKTFKEHLEVHHIMPIRRYPDLANNPENLVSLCQQCHSNYHKLYEGEEGAASFVKFIKKFGR